MKNKMVWKLAASFAIVLLLFTAVLGTVYLLQFRQHTIAINRVEMEKRAIGIADTLSSFQSEDRVDGRQCGMGGYGAYLRFMDEIAMADVWIVDDGLNIMTNGRGHMDTNYDQLPENAEKIVSRVFAGEITYGEEFSGLLDTPTLTVGAPICTEEGTVFGVVLLHSPVSGIVEAVRQGVSSLIAGMAVALVFAVCAAIWQSYRFTKPLQKMNNAASQLAEGDYTAKTKVLQNDEIGQLAITIDLLADHLSLAEQERVALDKLKEDFVANVSHELRTPVAVLRGSLEVLRDGTVDNPQEISEYYDHMLMQSCHLERLVNDLLDLSRLQDAQFQLQMGEVNLCDVVKDGVRGIRRLAQEKELSILAECPEEECLVQGDYGRIRQMFLILLDNSLKFSNVGGTIEVKLCRNEEAYALSVTDHGMGIPPDEIAYIFQRFRKTNSEQNKNGTGLGLAIAKQIAERHGAKIFVESQGGKTCFSIQFVYIR